MEKQPFIPLFARVLLRRERASDKIGSIIIPDQAKGRFESDEGILIACGEKVEPEIQEAIGKKVMFAKYSGAWVKVEDDEYFVCQEEDLIGIINGGADE